MATCHDWLDATFLLKQSRVRRASNREGTPHLEPEVRPAPAAPAAPTPTTPGGERVLPFPDDSAGPYDLAHRNSTARP